MKYRVGLSVPLASRSGNIGPSGGVGVHACFAPGRSSRLSSSQFPPPWCSNRGRTRPRARPEAGARSRRSRPDERAGARAVRQRPDLVPARAADRAATERRLRSHSTGSARAAPAIHDATLRAVRLRRAIPGIELGNAADTSRIQTAAARGQDALWAPYYGPKGTGIQMASGQAGTAAAAPTCSGAWSRRRISFAIASSDISAFSSRWRPWPCSRPADHWADSSAGARLSRIGGRRLHLDRAGKAQGRAQFADIHLQRRDDGARAPQGADRGSGRHAPSIDPVHGREIAGPSPTSRRIWPSSSSRAR